MDDSKNYHSVTKVEIDIEMKNEAKARATYETFRQLFRERFLGIIERIFSKHSTPHYHIRIEELIVELGQFEEKFNEEELVEKFAQKLEEALITKLFTHPQYINNAKIQKQSRIASDLEVFNYFIHYGTLPSFRNTTKLSLETIVKQQLKTQPNSIVRILRQTKPLGITRFVYQFSDNTIDQLFEVLAIRYYLTIRQHLQLFEKLYKKFLPAHLSIKSLLNEATILFLLANENAVFSLNNFRFFLAEQLQTKLNLTATHLQKQSTVTKIDLINHYFVHGWLPTWRNVDVNIVQVLIKEVMEEEPKMLRQLLETLQQNPQIRTRIEKELPTALQKELVYVVEGKTKEEIELIHFFETGILPEWINKNRTTFENWLIDQLKTNQNRIVEIINQFSIAVVVEKILSIFTTDGLQRFVKTVSPTTELSQIQASIQNELSATLEKELPKFIETTKNEQEEFNDIKEILKHFFETGIVPSWASSDILIFENWLIKKLATNRNVVVQAINQFSITVVVEKILSIFTTDGLQHFVKTVSPTTELSQIQTSIQNKLSATLEEELPKFIETTKNEQEELDDIKEILKHFFETGIVPSWASSDILIFENWLIKKLATNRNVVVQVIRQFSIVVVVEKILSIFTTDGLQRFVKTVSPTTELSQIQTSIQNELSATLEEELPKFIETTKNEQEELDDIKEILKHFFETGIVPSWASSDILIFENWLIKKLAANRNVVVQVINQFSIVVVVEKILSIFTTDGLQRFVKTVSPTTELSQIQASIQNKLSATLEKELPKFIETTKNEQEELDDIKEILKHFFETGIVPSWASSDILIFENWLIKKLATNRNVVVQVINQFSIAVVVEKILSIFTTDGLQRFVKTVSPTTELSQIQASIQNELSATLEEELPKFIERTKKQQANFSDVGKILKYFFETGIIPSWASTDVLIFENWLIERLENNRNIVVQTISLFSIPVVVEKLIAVFTINGLQRFVKTISPKLYNTLQNYTKEYLEGNETINKIEFSVYVLEKALTYLFILKGKQADTVYFLKTLGKEIEPKLKNTEIEAILADFIENGILPVWVDEDILLFEQWVLNVLDVNKTLVFDFFKKKGIIEVTDKIVNHFSLEGMFSLLKIIDSETYYLIVNYTKSLNLQQTTRIRLIKTALLFNFKKGLNHGELLILEKELLEVLEKQEANKPKITISEKVQKGENRGRKDTLAYLLKEGKLPFWSKSQTSADQLILELLQTEPASVKFIFQSVAKPSDFVERFLLNQFSEVAISQLINTLFPNYFGFVNTLVLAIEKLVKHPDFPTASTSKIYILKWKAILNYLIAALNQSLNLNQLISYALQEVLSEGGMKKETGFELFSTIIEKAIKKNETRFLALKSMLVLLRYQFADSVEQLPKAAALKTVKLPNQTFVKLLKNRGVPLGSRLEIDEKILNDFAPLVRLVVFEYYFLYGTFPIEWLQYEKSLNNLLSNLIIENPTSLKHIFRKNSQKEALFQPLVDELSENVLQKLIKLFYTTKTEQLRTYYGIGEKLFVGETIAAKRVTQNVLRLHLVKYVTIISENKLTLFHYIQHLTKAIARTYRIDYKAILTVLENKRLEVSASDELLEVAETLRKNIPKRYKPIPTKTADPAYTTWRVPKPNQTIYIENAGLVLVWPLLAFCFKNLKLLKPTKQFKDETAQERAVHILQYMATKQEKVPEEELFLNKIMCGIPVEKPIVRDITLTEEEKKWAEQLLKVIIQQWKVIKNTSPDGLRNSFMIREGKLMKKDNNWMLKVERKAFDMLIEKLPWMVSTVKLPWMKDALYVEW